MEGLAALLLGAASTETADCCCCSVSSLLPVSDAVGMRASLLGTAARLWRRAGPTEGLAAWLQRWHSPAARMIGWDSKHH